MGISLFGVAVYLPLFLQGVIGGSVAESGMIFAQYTLSMLAGNVIGGQLPPERASTGCLRLAGLSAVGLFLLSRMDGNTTQLVISGIGFGALTPTYEVLVQNTAPREQMGVTTGFTQLSRRLAAPSGSHSSVRCCYGSIICTSTH